MKPLSTSRTGGPLRAAVYTRVSTEDQARDGYSLEAQKGKTRQYADLHDWVIAGEYMDDGFSARNIRRPAYKRMMEEADRWDVLLIHKLDRIHRNQRNFVEMMDFLAKQGKQFACVVEQVDTSSAYGEFVMYIMQLVAQMESKVIGERVRMGMDQKARTEKCWLGRAPFGYQKRDGKLVKHPEEARWIHWMFQQFAQGTDMAAIRIALTESGVKRSSGLPWTYGRLRDTLSNPVYLGLRKYGRQAFVNHEPLVDEATFACCLQRVQARARTSTYSVPPPAFLPATEEGKAP